MPVVHVYVWKGFQNEAKEKIISGITNVFSNIGIPAEAVEVLIEEIPKENWGIGGIPASEKFKNSKF